MLSTALSILAAQPRPHWPASPYLIGSHLGLPLSFGSCFHFVDQHTAPVLFFIFFPPTPNLSQRLGDSQFALQTDVHWINGAPDTRQPHQAAFYVGLKDGAVLAWARTDCFGCQGYCLEAYVSDKSKDEKPFSQRFFFLSSHSSTHTTFTPAVLKIRAFIDAVHPGKPYSHSDFDMFS